MLVINIRASYHNSDSKLSNYSPADAALKTETISEFKLQPVGARCNRASCGYEDDQQNETAADSSAGTAFTKSKLILQPVKQPAQHGKLQES